ncbi:MAG: hypothetical protein ACP5NW_00490, partial [Candidatus Woesearchaeota archaeon]
YWFYSDSVSGCDNCRVGTLAPSLVDMERQISQYVSINMDSCLQNFSMFTDKGYVFSDAHQYLTDVDIVEDKIVVLMTNDILVEYSGDTEKLEKFYTEIDIPLKKYYDMATGITTQQMKNNFLENVVLYLLNSYSGTDTAKLPPMHDSTEGYDMKIWSLTATEQNFKDLLISYMPAIRVPGTKNYFEINTVGLSPSEAYFYNATRLNLLGNTQMPNTEISFLYLGQDIYFDIEPSQGDILRPETIKFDEFSIFSTGKIINKYDFYYQISYPVIVEIRDEYTPGSFFTFMFGLEGTIKDNLRIVDYLSVENSPIYWDESFVNIQLNFPDDAEITADMSDPQFGGYAGILYQNYESQPAAPDVPRNFEKTFCDSNQRLSGIVKLRTYDSVTELPLSDVRVKFGCGNFVECDVGNTVFNRTLQESSYQSKLPTCLGGYLKLTKEGYVPKNIALSTDSKINTNLGSIFMDPLMTKDITVTKHYVNKYVVLDESGEEKYVSYTLANGSESLSGNDSVIITLNMQSFSPLAEPYSSSAILSKTYGINKTTLTLAPGVYAVNIQLLDHRGVVIPKECKFVCTKYDGDECEEGERIPESDIPIQPAQLGGISFENRTLFYISPEDLMSDNVLEFQIIRLPNPTCFEDIDDTSDIGSISEKYKTILLPRFVPRE